MEGLSMKVVEYNKYGSPNVLKIVSRNKPTLKPNEVLIKVYYSTVSQVDSIFRRGNNFFARIASGVLKPKVQVLGYEFSGIIELIGNKVKNFKVGDEIFGATIDGTGTLSEYICLSEDGPFIHKPENLLFDHAAAFPSGVLTALPFLRDGGKIKNGDDVLIIGASGSIGTYAVQLAKHFGATVTGVCSTQNIELVKSLGADKVIDYTVEDFTQNNNKFDIIFDTVGKSSFYKSNKSLKSGGVYLTTYITFGILVQMLLTTIILKKDKSAKILFTGMRSFKDKITDLIYISKLIEEDKIKAFVDKIYPMESISEAHAYVDKGHKRGNIVIHIN
jgi:NADPH:quinone reductase-like Zn-dependent oxidoreductase